MLRKVGDFYIVGGVGMGGGPWQGLPSECLSPFLPSSLGASPDSHCGLSVRDQTVGSSETRGLGIVLNIELVSISSSLGSVCVCMRAHVRVYMCGVVLLDII